MKSVIVKRLHPSPIDLNLLIRMASDIRAPTTKAGKPREKVALKPGFHLMDWHRLMQASNNFDTRNGGPPRRVSMAELKEHRSEFDCWTAYNGKVYNITQYMHYHPGGVKQLMAGAGKDCTKAFNKFHAWVNIDNILAKCYIGPLGEDNAKNSLQEGNEDDEEEGSEDEEAVEARQERERLREREAQVKESAFKSPQGAPGADLKAHALAALMRDDEDDVADAKCSATSTYAQGKNEHEDRSCVKAEGVATAASTITIVNDQEFIAQREAEDAENFRLAVDMWRKDKAEGRGEAKIVESGGDFGNTDADTEEAKEL